MNKFLVLLMLPLALTACKDKNNPIAQPMKDADLQGTWQSTCEVKPLGAVISGFMTEFQASVKAQRVQYKFDANRLQRVTLVYNTADCTGQESYVWNESGVFDVKDKVQVANVGDAKGLDMDFNKVVLTVRDENGLKIANERKLCGRADWAVDKEQPVTANSKEANCYGVPVPRKSANIYRIDKPAGDVRWTISFGADPTTPAAAGQRPATLSPVKFEKDKR